MKKCNYILLFCLLGQIASCSYGYRATGKISDEALVLKGKADLRNSGGGSFTLSSLGNELMCEGHAETPESGFPSPGCAGEAGKGRMRCSDGRIFILDWKAITCRAFEGGGQDQKGNTVHFSVRKDHF